MTDSISSVENAPEYILLRGQVVLGKLKAPFVRSGKSLHAAIEYDPEEDKLRCHECGRWFENLGTHVWGAHGLLARQYKVRHGLHMGSALVCLRISEKISRDAKASPTCIGKEFAQKGRDSSAFRRPGRIGPSFETRNNNGQCAAQLLSRVRAMADKLGRTPTSRELLAAGINHRAALNAFNVKDFTSLMTLAGLQPRESCKRVYSDVVLIEILLDHHARYGRVPLSAELKRPPLPNEATFVKHFGSMQAAYETAGIQHRAKPSYSDAALIEALRGFYAMHGRVPHQADLGHGTMPSMHTFRHHFGSLRAAYAAAGLPSSEAQKKAS